MKHLRQLSTAIGTLFCLLCTTPAMAEGENVTIEPPAAATREEGLAAFDRIYEVKHRTCHFF